MVNDFHMFEHLPEEVHVEESPDDETEAQVQEGRDEDTRETGAFDTHEVIPELGKVCCRDHTVILVAL